jgi:hypothetical protein
MTRTILALAASALCASAAIATPAKAPTYLLTMKLTDGDRIVGTPRLEITAGEPARIEIGTAGGDRYAMDLTATPQADGRISMASAIDVVHAGGVRRAAKPTLLVNPGETSAIAFGVDSGQEKSVRVEFTVAPLAGR